MTRSPRSAAFVLALALAACASFLAASPAAAVPPEVVALRGAANFLTGYPALLEDGSMNMVVEIPAGTLAKWEVSASGDEMEWELQDGARRLVHYLGYPGNYGMVPRSVQSERTGGDGDPLDVLLLGDAVSRGSVVRVRPIGVLRLTDTGERDDKILAVPLEGFLADVTDLDRLDAAMPGARSIVETWFTHYKGPGRVTSQGFAGAAEARKTVQQAADDYEAAHPDKAKARSRRGR